MFRTVTVRLASILSAAALTLIPSVLHAQKALVYCPVGIDAAGCNAIVAAITADAARFPGGADAGFDGTQGTVDLAGADLSGYAVFVVPSLADGAGVQPYALLRDGTIAARIKAAFMGRTAVWSGTPDVGSTNRAVKDQLIRNLAAWSQADPAGTHGPGIVVLQDNSDVTANRYSWLTGISSVTLTADSTLNVYSNVQALTTAATAILTGSNGLQMGYTNMASFGLVPGAGANSDATGGRTAAVVLVTMAGAPSDPNLATVSSDKEDYQPGDTITVTGAGWEPGETVSLLFHEEVDPPIHPDKTLSAVADPNGRVLSHEYEVEETDLGVRFTLTATGQTSGRTAQTTFTDDSKTVLAATATTPITASITAISYTTTETCTGANTNLGSFNLVGSPSTSITTGNINGQSVKLTAGATATNPSGSPFLSWTGTGTFTLVSGEPLAICVPGTNGNQSDTFRPLYQTTSTSLASSSNPSVFGQTVTFTATVTSSIGGSVNSGTVSFKDGSTTLASPTVNGSGVATFSTSALSVATHSITATYNGSGNFTTSTSNTVSQVVNPASTSTTITSDTPDPSVAGQAVTVNYAVVATAPGAGTVTGNVTVTDGVDTCTGTVTAGTCTISLTTLGARSLIATYTATTNFNGSSSAGTPHQVNQAPSTTTLVSSANPSVFGQIVVLTATVKNGATAITVGNISFIEGGTCASPGTVLQANQTPSATGVVTYTTSAFSVAGHNVIACYDGSAGFAASQATLTQTVNKAATTTTISSDTPDPSSVGQAVTVNYTVAVTSPGSGTPTGNVTVSDGTDSCTGTVAAGTCSITLNTAGARTLTATYAGDGNFTGSTSAGAPHQVNQLATTTAVTSSLNPSTFGTSVTFTATVTNGANPVTAGNVTFIEGGTCAAPTTTLQTAQAVNGSGQVTFATAALTVASHTVVGCYAGTATFAASSGSVVQVVNMAPTTLTVAPASGTFGGTAALSATLTRSSDGPIAGKTITFTLNGSPAGTATTNASGVASIAAASLGTINAGSYPTGVGASFTSDGSFASATGTAALTVSQATVTVTVTVIPTSIAYGALVELDADLAPGLSGRTISFSIDGTPVGTDVTSGSGKAKLMNVNPATAGIGVGSHTVTATFPAEQNYGTATGTGSLTITQAATTTAVTSSLNPSAFGQAVTFTATVTSAGGTPTGSASFIEGGTCASPGTTLQAAAALDGTGKVTFATSTLSAGSHTVAACFLGSTNFAASTGTVAQTVNKATPTVTWTNPADITYGTALSATQLNATASVPGSFVYTPAAGTVLAAGNNQTLSVAFTPTDATNYNSVPSTTVGINVLQRPVTVTADAGQTKVYGEADPAFTYQITSGSLVTGDAFIGALSRATGEHVAGSPYAITQGTLSLGGNYLLSFVSAGFSITARPVTVTADPETKVYGEADPALTYQVTTGSVITGDHFTGSLARAPGEAVGSYAITQGTLALSTDYTLSFVGANLSITTRPVTVTADPETKVYGEADPAFTYKLTSGTLVTGDAFTGALSRAAGENVGTHAILQGTLALSTNYLITYVGADLTITTRPVEVTADPETKVYGEDDPAFTYQITSGSLAFSDAFSGALSRDAGEHVADNPYAITQGTLTLGTNYALTFVGAGLTITHRPVTVTAEPKTKVYGDPDPAFTYHISSGSLAFSDGFTGSLARAAGESVAGSPYAITQGTLALTDDYTLSFVGSTLTIGARPVTVTADPQTKVYGEADPALTYKITSGSRAFSDDFSGALTRAPGENVGGYAILQGTLSLGPNYTLSYVGDNLSITARPVTVTADPETKVYGETDPAFTYKLTSGSLVTGDAFSGALSRAAGEDVGTHAILQGTLALSTNYVITYVGANLTITTRPVEVTADPQTKVYGEDDPAFTYHITSGSLAFSDAFSGALSRDAGEHVVDSPYAITQGTLTLGTNYELTFVSAGLTITRRPVTATADPKTKVYGNPDPALTYQVTSGSLAFTDAFTGGLTRAPGETVAGGPYAITQGTLALTDDYTLSFVGSSLAISTRPVTVTADPQTKVYGNADPALTYQITSGSLAFSDDFSGALTRTVGENVGTYAILQGTLSLGPNYALSYVGADLSITTRPVTVTADPQTKVYGETDPALTYKLTSGTLVTGDAFSGALSRAAGEDVGTHAILQGSLTLGTNYFITYVGADLTITTRPVTVTADAQTKVYGESDPAFTYKITSGSLAFSDAFSGALTRVVGENVGSYAIQQGTLTLGTNYELSYVGADLSITTRPVTVTADAGQGKVYGNADPVLAYHITSGSLAFSDAFSGALTRAGGENVGSYAIQQGTLALGTNYVLTFVGANFAISQRPVTVTANAKAKVYGNPDPALTYYISSGSLAFSDAFSGALSRAAGENVGTYAIQQGTLALSTNYVLTYVGADLTIGTRPVTVTADTKSKVYGNADPALTYQITSGSLAFSDAFTGGLTRAPGETVLGSPYAIGKGTLALSTNYVLTFVGANFAITTRPVAIAADPKSKIFGQADPALTYHITSGTLVTGDAFSGALTRVAGEAVGSYAIQQGTVSLGSNYSIAYTGANLTITAWTVAGYYQPVDMATGGMVWNTIKGGQTVPLKFQIFAGSVERTDVGAVKAFTATPTSCGTPGTEDNVEITTTGGTELRYSGGQFIQNWQTPKGANICYRTTMTALDGSQLTAFFKTK
jgi:hypothetical protein